MSFNSKSFSADIYNWSKSEINIFFAEDISSKIIGQIKTGDKVEILEQRQSPKRINEFWILETKESKDTIILSGKMLKVKYKNIIGFCFDTFLIHQKFIEAEIEKENIISAFDYYSKINTLKEIKKEEEKIKDGDDNIERGETIYNDNSILTYEYNGYGGGFEFLLEEDKYKEFQIITLKILELKPREFYQINKSENTFTIETDECEFISIEKKENSKTAFGFSNGC